MKRRSHEPTEQQKRARQGLAKIGILLVNFALLFFLLRLLIELSARTGKLWIYYAGSLGYGILAGGLFVAFFILNGFTLSRDSLGWDDLPSDWTDERKRTYLEKQPGRKARARQLLYVLLPLVIVFLVDFVELNFFG